MRCQNYQQRLIRTLVKDRESISKSRLRRCRAQMLVLKSRFQSATAPELEREVHPLVWVFERIKSLIAIIILLAESARGQLEQLFKNGTATPRRIREVREEARKSNYNFRGNVSIAKIDPKMDLERSLEEVETALKKVIGDIEGFDFLANTPKGKEKNEHTVLIKVGVNWGILGYPSVTSWESVYAVTKLCLEEAKSRRVPIKVIVGDESGIEINLWEGTTMHNFEQTGVLHAAVLAGVDHAASLEAESPVKFEGAGELLKRMHEGYRVTNNKEDTLSQQMIEMADKAGVEKIIGFQPSKDKDVIGSKSGDKDFIRIPVPAGEKVKHFKEGIFIPRIVAEEVTDIINLPKPPGRHMIMGNTGLTGALKNHVGLLKPSDRLSQLHGEAGPLLRSLSERGPGMGFHEKIAEIYLAFKDRERFSAVDMRWTISSLGPDFGDTIDVGAVIAAKDPVTLDAVAAALLNKRYVEIGSWFDALKLGGDTFWEYLAGKTWLRKCTPFDLKSHIAANSYGIGPIDLDHIDFKGFESSGFRVRELDTIAGYLRITS